MNACTITAETFGMIAFAAGKQASPCLDQDLMDMIKNNPNKEIGASLPLLKAWQRGWHKANLAAIYASKKVGAQLDDGVPLGYWPKLMEAIDTWKPLEEVALSEPDPIV